MLARRMGMRVVRVGGAGLGDDGWKGTNEHGCLIWSIPWRCFFCFYSILLLPVDAL